MRRLFALSAAAIAATILAAAPDQPATGPASRLTVASYNINYGNANLPAVVEAIVQADADLVCLQEANRQSEVYIRKHLGDRYKHIAFRNVAWAGGFAFLSKTAFRDLRWLPPRHGPFGTWIAQVDFDKKRLQIANVHLVPTDVRGETNPLGAMRKFAAAESVRAREAQYLISKLAPKIPTLLVGDFNTVPAGIVATNLQTAGWIDSFAAADKDADPSTWRSTTGGQEFKFRLDYIFHGPQLKAESCRIVRTEGSDHYLVLSSLAWAPPGESQPASGSGGRESKLPTPAPTAPGGGS